MQVQELTWDEVKTVRRPAARDGVSISVNKAPTRWFGVKDGGRVVATGGLMKLSADRYRLRGGWVAASHREMGLGTLLLDHRLGLIPANATVDVWTRNPNQFTSHGWTAGNRNRFGATHCRKDTP